MPRYCGEEQNKITFQGTIISIQPRSNVWRYLVDNRTHSLTGYNVFISASCEISYADFPWRAEEIL